MDTVWVEIAKQVPALAVLAFIVVAFLKFLTREGEVARAFIASEGQQTREALGRHAVATDKLADHVNGLTSIIRDHEASSEERHRWNNEQMRKIAEQTLLQIRQEERLGLRSKERDRG